MTVTTVESQEMPVFPLARPARCPFDPPTEYRSWQQDSGPRQVRLPSGQLAWVVTKHDEARASLSDPRLSNDILNPRMPKLQPFASSSANNPGTLAFIRMDDPEHARQRRMLTAAFTVKQTESMRPMIQELVDARLDRMIRNGPPADLVSVFALPIPSEVITHMLGISYEEHTFFQSNASMIIDLTNTPEEAGRAFMALTDFFGEIVSQKEREPGDDLVSQLLSQRVATGELTREFLVTMMRTLLIAGHETTANMIALSTLTLLRNPEQLARVRDAGDPALIANAVEELLRYLSITENLVYRVAAEDFTISDQLVRAGEGVIISLPTANRDATVFESPDKFDIDRNTAGHIAFGYGVHQCLGQNLARVELQVAVPTLLRRLPGLRLAVPFEEVSFRADTGTYGVHRLPIEWQPYQRTT
jgi:cytochrome P450